LGFHRENRTTFTTYNPETLRIGTLSGEYSSAIDNEDTAMEQIRRSADTPRTAAATVEFDESFIGMHTFVQACRRHVSPDIRQSAENLDVVFRKYGNIGKHSYREELTMSHSLLDDLRLRPVDVASIGLVVWMDAHEQAAVRLRELIDERLAETSARTDLRVSETRRQTNLIFHRIVARLEAMINLDGVDFVPGVVAAYNTHATEYRNTLAQHLGRIHAKNSEQRIMNNEL
jgi:hypothetical protein